MNTKQSESNILEVFMILKIFIQRIWENKFRNILTLVIVLLPMIDLLLYLYDIIAMSGYVPIPDHAFFLTCNSNYLSFLTQYLFLWFMPLYGLILTCDDCIEDHRLKYDCMVISRIGKKKYIHTHMMKSFIYMFSLTAIALLLNLLLCHILFQNGVFNTYGEDFNTDVFYQWEKNHPLLTNLLFISITSFFSGLIAVVGVMSSILFKNKRMIYGITMMMWIVPTLQEKSLMLLFQPHSEYVLNTLIPIGVKTAGIYIVYIIVIYGKEIIFEKKMAENFCNFNSRFLR